MTRKLLKWKYLYFHALRKLDKNANLQHREVTWLPNALPNDGLNYWTYELFQCILKVLVFLLVQLLQLLQVLDLQLFVQMMLIGITEVPFRSHLISFLISEAALCSFPRSWGLSTTLQAGLSAWRAECHRPPPQLVSGDPSAWKSSSTLGDYVLTLRRRSLATGNAGSSLSPPGSRAGHAGLRITYWQVDVS